MDVWVHPGGKSERSLLRMTESSNMIGRKSTLRLRLLLRKVCVTNFNWAELLLSRYCFSRRDRSRIEGIEGANIFYEQLVIVWSIVCNFLSYFTTHP